MKIRKNIDELVAYSSARSEYAENDGIFLDANENPYGVYNRYPDPFQKRLKERIAVLKNCSVQQIYLGNGSDEIIDLAFRIFCDPQTDIALTFVPTYGMYEVAAKINNVELIKLPLDSNFQIDIQATEPYLQNEKLKLIFICSPNNPTGNLLNYDDILYILDNFSGIVIIDEAYIDFAEQPSFIQILDRYPNLIVSQTLSKAWGMAGVRIGIAMMNENIAAIFNKVKPPYNISACNQEIALQSLNNIERFKQNLKGILSEKKKLYGFLGTFKAILKIYPTDANFILIEVENADNLYHYLIENKMIIRNRNSAVKNCVRITIGTPAENQRLMDLLKVYYHE